MKILVSGGSGQLGCSIRKISGNYPDYEFYYTDIPETDITSPESVSAVMDIISPGCVINCSAYTAVDRAESDERAAFRVNAVGPAILASVCRERNVKLIHISTDYVFDGLGSSPLHEESATDPMSVYGRTKLAGEEAVRDSSCDAVVVRTSWLYSEYGSNFLKTMLSAAQSRPELDVVYDQIGTPTYATDLAAALLELAGRKHAGFGLYHYSNQGVASWYDFAKEIFSIAGIDTPVRAIETSMYPTPARRPRYSVLSKKKIMAEGIKVPYWRDSLLQCMTEFMGY